jgi:salicylate hydroxylase
MTPPIPIWVRDAEITAHAAFRKRLYDHDVVPDAQAAAATLR